MHLKVNDIFYSIQGETSRAGFPSVFIRLTGCNLRCICCDTPGAWTEGSDMKIEEIMSEAGKYRSPHHITITGGEPLTQTNTYSLMDMLIHQGYDSQIETNGSLDISRVPGKIRKIVDVKTPSTMEAGSFLQTNIAYIGDSDELKFIIANREDYEFSKKFIREFLPGKKSVVNFSPAWGMISYRELSKYILDDRLIVRLNLQLHKIIDIK